jgi:hypothetical protein
LLKQKDTPFAAVKYEVIFDDKVVKALETKDLKNAIEDYIRRYNQLLAGRDHLTITTPVRLRKV